MGVFLCLKSFLKKVCKIVCKLELSCIFDKKQDYGKFKKHCKGVNIYGPCFIGGNINNRKCIDYEKFESCFFRGWGFVF